MQSRISAASRSVPAAVSRNKNRLTRLRYDVSTRDNRKPEVTQPDTGLRFDDFTQRHTDIPKSAPLYPAFTHLTVPPLFTKRTCTELLYRSSHITVIDKAPSASIGIQSYAAPIRTAISDAAVRMLPSRGAAQLLPLSSHLGTSGMTAIPTSVVGAQLLHAAAACGLLSRKYIALLDVTDASSYGSPLLTSKAGVAMAPLRLVALPPAFTHSSPSSSSHSPSSPSYPSSPPSPSPSSISSPSPTRGVPLSLMPLLADESCVRILEPSAEPAVVLWRALDPMRTVGAVSDMNAVDSATDSPHTADRMMHLPRAHPFEVVSHRGSHALASSSATAVDSPHTSSAQHTWRYPDGTLIPLRIINGRSVMTVELVAPLSSCEDIRAACALRPPFGLAAPIVGDVGMYPLPESAPRHMVSAAALLGGALSGGASAGAVVSGGGASAAVSTASASKLHMNHSRPSLYRGPPHAPLCLRVRSLSLPDVSLLLASKWGKRLGGGVEGSMKRAGGADAGGGAGITTVVGGVGGADDDADMVRSVALAVRLLETLTPPTHLAICDLLARSHGLSSIGDGDARHLRGDARDAAVWFALVTHLAGGTAAEFGLPSMESPATFPFFDEQDADYGILNSKHGEGCSETSNGQGVTLRDVISALDLTWLRFQDGDDVFAV